MFHQKTLPSADLSHREIAHDLRNLFGVVASATHLLESDSRKERSRELITAIENAALAGGKLADELLAPRRSSRPIDLAERIAGLELMMRALLPASARLTLDLRGRAAIANLDPEALDATMLELVTNARSAIGPSGRVIVRLRKIGGKAWLIIADDGHGMDRVSLRRSREGAQLSPTDQKGLGLSRVRTFLGRAHGHLHIRSRAGRGTVICMIVPLILSLAIDNPAGPTNAGHFQEKEADDEERQSNTA